MYCACSQFQIDSQSLNWLKAALGSNVRNSNKAFNTHGDAMGAGRVAYLSMQAA